VSAYFDYHRYF